MYALSLVVIATFFTPTYLSAQEKEQDRSKRNIPSIKSNGKIANFDLKRDITVCSNSTELKSTTMLCNRIAELLRDAGSNDVKISRNRGDHTIHVNKVDMIVGVNQSIKDAYCIKVYKNRIELQYMSAKSMAWAFNALKKLIVKEQSFLQGIFNMSSLYIQSASLCETTGSSGGFEIVDITQNKMNVATLKNHISSAALNNKFVIYLKIVSTEGVAVKSEIINSVNPFLELANGGISYGELNELQQFAQENGIELIPLLDLISEQNIYFEEYTGHKIHSTEGLRFSLALVNEFALKTDYTVICIGGEPANDTIKVKYVNPIVELFNTYGRDVVIHTNQ